MAWWLQGLDGGYAETGPPAGQVFSTTLKQMLGGCRVRHDFLARGH